MQLRISRSWALSVGLVLLALLVFGQVAGFQFLSFDDPLYVTGNPRTLAGLDQSALRWAFANFEDGSYLPLVWLSHAACVQVFGTHPAGHHLVNLALHLANTLLVFHLLRAGTGDEGTSAAVAALFAIHPAHVESVAWVAARKDLLSTLFWLLATSAYGRWVRCRRPVWYAWMLVLFLLGLLSKSLLVVFPLTLLLLDLWPLGRLRADADRPWWRQLAALAWEKAPLFALSAAAGGLTIWAQGRVQAVASIQLLSFTDRVANALQALLAYLRILVWPVDLSPFYTHPGPHWSPARVALALLLLGACTWSAVAFARRKPWIAAGWGWFLATLLPVLGLVQVGSQSHADRYTYVPYLGLFVIAGLAGKSAAAALPRLLGSGLLACGVATLGALAWVQASRWQDSETLFAHALSLDPSNQVALGNLGTVLAEQGRFTEAIGAYQRAAELNPTYHGYRLVLGNLLARIGQEDAALAHWLEADRLDPTSPRAASQIGRLLARRGQWLAALPWLKKATAAAPGTLGRDPDLDQRVRVECRQYLEEAERSLVPGNPEANQGVK